MSHCLLQLLAFFSFRNFKCGESSIEHVADRNKKGKKELYSGNFLYLYEGFFLSLLPDCDMIQECLIIKVNSNN